MKKIRKLKLVGCGAPWNKILLTMKLSILFLLFNLIQLSANVYSQNSHFQLKEKNMSLKQIFNEIESQTNYRFAYRESFVDDNEIMNALSKNMTVEEFLDNVVKKMGYGYLMLEDNLVVITAKDDKFLMQEITIKGKITDIDGNSLPGVNVVEKGSTNGAVTNLDGEYTISVSSPNAILSFSYVGFLTEEVAIAGQTNINLTMVEDIQSLEEVVVVGYGIQKKVNLTGSVATVDEETIKRAPVANVSNALVGNLPGLIAMNRSGEPGKDASELSIRGFSNMLVIVDGIPGSLNDINPNEIDNISILKDGASSIYGARAGNGVILVTTKRGSIGKPKFTFSSTFGLQAPTRLPELVGAPKYARIMNESEAVFGRDPIYSDEEIAKYETGSDPSYPNTDWYNQVFNKYAPISQYNLNTSGGSEEVKYFISLGYLDQMGILKSGDINYKRYNIRSNVDANISKSFSIALDLSASLEKSQNPGKEIADIMQSMFFAQPVYPAQLPDNTKTPFTGQPGNQPMAAADKDISGYTNNNTNNYLGKITLNYDVPFVKGLSAKASISYGEEIGYDKEWRKQYSLYTYDYNTKEYTTANVTGKNSLKEYYLRSYNLTSQIYVNYEKNFGEHGLQAMVVGEYLQGEGNKFNAYREGYITTAIDQLFAGEDLNKDNGGSAWQAGRIGYAGRLNYAYSGKYLAEATFRYDASAKFIEDARWGFFPSVSLGWRLSEESFMQNISALDNFKLRVSYGEAGNDYVGNYNYLTGYSFRGTTVFGESAQIHKGIRSIGLANPDLTWESTATSNLGIDASFLKGLLGFEFDVFYRKVTDVPGYRSLSLPYNFGAELPEENINSYDDRGFELRLTHTNKIGDFNYSIDGNVSWARSKWIHYDEPIYTDDETRERLQKSGQWKNRWFGYEALGLFQSQTEIDNWTVDQDGQNNATIEPGDIKYADYNGDGILNFEDNHVIGRGNTPEVIFGLSLTGGYKGFDLSMLWQGATNYNNYFIENAQITYLQGGMVPFEYLTDYWTEDNPDAEFPRLYLGGAANNKHESSYWLQDGTYLRLKNIQLGYTFPTSWFSRVGVESFKLYVSGYNLITLTEVYLFDPETGDSETGTGRGWHYPQQKSYNFGINLVF